jgi:hypothetical protein
MPNFVSIYYYPAGWNNTVPICHVRTPADMNLFQLLNWIYPDCTEMQLLFAGARVDPISLAARIGDLNLANHRLYSYPGRRNGGYYQHWRMAPIDPLTYEDVDCIKTAIIDPFFGQIWTLRSLPKRHATTRQWVLGNLLVTFVFFAVFCVCFLADPRRITGVVPSPIPLAACKLLVVSIVVSIVIDIIEILGIWMGSYCARSCRTHIE